MPPASRRPKDPDERARAELEARLARDTEISDLQWLMGLKQGRRVMHRLLEKSGIYQTVWTGEALSMAFREGQRNFGLYLMNELLQHCPKRLSEMQRENLKHERSDSSTSTGTSGGQPGTGT